MGRKKTSGRYNTREELERNVVEDYIQYYLNGSASLADLERMNGISHGTLSEIWKKCAPLSLKFIDHKNGGPKYVY
jgi:hypothetical protein